MNILCRKNELGKLLNNMKSRFGNEFDFFPKTWMMPYDQRQFEEHVSAIKDEQFDKSLMNGKQY